MLGLASWVCELCSSRSANFQVRGPMLRLMPFCHCLEIINNFQQGVPCFHLALFFIDYISNLTALLMFYPNLSLFPLWNWECTQVNFHGTPHSNSKGASHWGTSGCRASWGLRPQLPHLSTLSADFSTWHSRCWMNRWVNKGIANYRQIPVDLFYWQHGQNFNDFSFAAKSGWVGRE